MDLVGKVKVTPTPCPGAKAKSRCRGGGSPKDFTEATSQVVMLPILVNKVRLRAGQQLLVFKKAATKRAREARDIAIAQLAKKPRGPKRLGAGVASRPLLLSGFVPEYTR